MLSMLLGPGPPCPVGSGLGLCTLEAEETNGGAQEKKGMTLVSDEVTLGREGTQVGEA